MPNRLEDIRDFVSSPARAAAILVTLGFVVWTSLSLWAGLTQAEIGHPIREAWDTAAYFYIGLPIMAVAVGGVAFIHPAGAWRWPLALVAGHQAGVLLFGLGMQSGLSLLILALMLGMLLGAGFALPAFIGSTAARRLAERWQ